MDAPERIWAIFEKHHSGRGHPHVLATCEETKGYKYRRADLCADPALLAEAVEKFAALEKAASEVSRRGAETGPQWTKLTIALLAARAFIEKWETRHE